MFDDGFVGHAANLFESGDGAVDGFSGEIAKGQGLVAGEARGTELLVGAIEDVLGRGVSACDFEGHYGREGFNKATVDGGGSLAVELLVDDGFDERFEGGLSPGDTHGERADAGDELAEFGVGCGEVGKGCGGVVGRLAGARGVHGGSLVQLSVVSVVQLSVGVCRCQFWCWG